MEMVVLIVKQINVSEHMLFLVSINLITIVTILINVHNYRKNKKRDVYKRQCDSSVIARRWIRCQGCCGIHPENMAGHW